MRLAEQSKRYEKLYALAKNMGMIDLLAHREAWEGVKSEIQESQRDNFLLSIQRLSRENGE